MGFVCYSFNRGFESYTIMGLMRFYENYLKLLLKHRTEGYLLDVGAGRGEFMDLAKKHFKVMGVDIRTNRGDIYNMDIEKDLPAGEYDIITCWAVLEHLTHPEETFRRLMTLLKSGGLVIVHTTNKISLSYALQRTNWGWFGPGHKSVDVFDELYLKRMFDYNDVKVLEVEKYNFTGKRGRVREMLLNSRVSPVRYLVDKLGVGDLITMVGVKK